MLRTSDIWHLYSTALCCAILYSTLHCSTLLQLLRSALLLRHMLPSALNPVYPKPTRIHILHSSYPFFPPSFLRSIPLALSYYLLFKRPSPVTTTTTTSTTSHQYQPSSSAVATASASASPESALLPLFPLQADNWSGRGEQPSEEARGLRVLGMGLWSGGGSVHGEGHCERPSKRVIRSVLDWTGLLHLNFNLFNFVLY